MALIDRIRNINRQAPSRKYYRLFVNDVAVGFVDTQVIDKLLPTIFKILHERSRVDIRFKEEEREFFEKEIDIFFKDFFSKYKIEGWRNELYGVSESFNSPTLFLIERAALSFLGITGYGVHVNGYVEKEDSIYMWIAKRSLSKPTFPGKLDQIAAGGIPYGINPWDNVLKECNEEASISINLASKAKSVSAISYFYDLDIGARPDVIFNYDLCLPADFTPIANDGEVDLFELMPIGYILQLIEETEMFKFNSAAVIVDFAIRHGIINPSHLDYFALQEGMNLRYKRMQAL